jgi:hypothetical protein
MAVTKLKPPPPDPLRVRLQEAIAAAAEARDVLDRHQQAHGKTRRAMWDAERSVRVAEEGIAKARAAHAAAIADVAVDDDALPPSDIVRLARQSVTDAQDEHEALKGAFARLREDLPGWQADADKAAAELEDAISAVLAPIAEQLLARLRELMAEAMPYRSLLAGLLDAHRDRVVDSRGRQSLGPALDAAGKLTWTYSLDDVAVTSDPWLAARARLRENPNASIDDLFVPASTAD